MDRPLGGRPLEILFVGTDDAAIQATRSSLRDAGIANDLVVLAGGSAAVERLGDGGAEATPDVVLLDGDSVDVETVSLVGEATDTAATPVVTLGPKLGTADGATASLAKPVDALDLLEVLLETDEVWLRVVRGPTRHEAGAPGTAAPPCEEETEAGSSVSRGSRGS